MAVHEVLETRLQASGNFAVLQFGQQFSFAGVSLGP